MNVLPSAQFAGHRQFAPQGRGEAAADGQPQPGPAETPGHRAVGLHEGVEDLAQPLGRNPDAGVDHVDRQLGLLGIRQEPGNDFHPAALGELDRVADEVGDDLPEAGSDR